MSRFYKFIFALLILILFAEVLIFAPRTLEEPEVAPNLIPLEEGQQKGRVLAEQDMQGVHLVETHEGGRDWELFAEQARGYEGEAYWELETVRVVFYSAPGVSFTVVGEEGRIELTSKNMIIRGNVLITSSNGYRFQTELVNYEGEKRILDCPSKVDIRGPADEYNEHLYLSGGQMTADLSSSNVVITNGVQARKLMQPDSRKLNIRSRQAEVSGKSFRANFTRNVQIGFNSISAIGPQASFHIDPKTKNIVNIQMKGGVSVKESEKTATSQALMIDFPNDRVEMTGFPKLNHLGDEIMGEVIVFLEGGKRIKVEDARARVRQDSVGDTL